MIRIGLRGKKGRLSAVGLTNMLSGHLGRDAESGEFARATEHGTR